MTMTVLAVRTEALTKVFRLGLRGRPITAVHRVDLTIEPGEIFGFLVRTGQARRRSSKSSPAWWRPRAERSGSWAGRSAHAHRHRRSGFFQSPGAITSFS